LPNLLQTVNRHLGNETFLLQLNCNKDEAKAMLSAIFKRNKGFRSFRPNLAGRFTGDYTFRAHPKYQVLMTRNSNAMAVEISGEIIANGEHSTIKVILEPNYVLRFTPIVTFFTVTIIMLFGKHNNLAETLIIGPLLILFATAFPVLYLRSAKQQLKDVFSSIFIAQIINRFD
jgi:hypothetical protein